MTTQPTATHGPDIARAIRNHDPATVALVEDLMRGQHGTLDHLDARRFTRAARQAMADAIGLALIGELADYCETLDLDVPTLRG
jgi:hypothetical protein